jgi:hypothetical protein
MATQMQTAVETTDLIEASGRLGPAAAPSKLVPDGDCRKRAE